jgi:hypothetical protein
MPDLATYERVVPVVKPILRGRGIPAWLGVLILALALAGGAALKIASKVYIDSVEVDLRNPIALFLQRHGYSVARVAMDKDPSKVVVAGSRGLSCQLQVIEAQARGYNQTSIRQMAGPTDDFFVIFQGAVYDAQPILQTRAYYYWDRLRREMGIAVPPRPVLAVIASAPCSARDLPWNDALHR